MIILEKIRSKEILLVVAAWVAVVAGIIGMYFFLYQSYKPELLQLKVFTVYSSYIKNKYFTFITNNQGDELAIAMYCVGWLLLIWKRYKSLKNRQAMVIIVFLLAYLLLHGMAILYFCAVFFLLLPLLVLIK